MRTAAARCISTKEYVSLGDSTAYELMREAGPESPVRFDRRCSETRPLFVGEYKSTGARDLRVVGEVHMVE